MTKIITYSPKITGAKTQYREISPADHDWLIQYLLQGLVTMSTLSNTLDEDQRIFREQYWRRRRDNLPRGRNGKNSPESMVAGLLHNMLYSTPAQRDFTDHQMDAIEDISRWWAAVDPNNLPDIRFQIGVI